MVLFKLTQSYNLQYYGDSTGTFPTMYQNMVNSVSENSCSVLLDGTDTSTQINLDIEDLDYILPHPTMEYSQFNQSILGIHPFPTQQTVSDTNLPISCDPINNQPNSFPTTPTYCTQEWGNNTNRFHEKQEAVNTTHIADSTKHLGKMGKSNHKKKTPIVITPSPRGYSSKTPKPKQNQRLNKHSQTNLSFSNKQDTVESSRYSAVHMALSKLESMPKPEKNPNNGAAYILRNQRNRQLVLQGLNIEMAEINKAEAKRYYTVNCARNYTIKDNPTDSN